MRREFVSANAFLRNWAAVGLGDAELRELERILIENPNAGAVIPHLSGARKLRVALEGRGKSGGAWVVYVDVVVRERIYLLTAYPKNVQTDLSNEQRKILHDLITELKEGK